MKSGGDRDCARSFADGLYDTASLVMSLAETALQFLERSLRASEYSRDAVGDRAGHWVAGQGALYLGDEGHAC